MLPREREHGFPRGREVARYAPVVHVDGAGDGLEPGRERQLQRGVERQRRKALARHVGIDFVQIAIGTVEVNADADARNGAAPAAAPAPVQHLGIPAQRAAGAGRQGADVLPVAQAELATVNAFREIRI